MAQLAQAYIHLKPYAASDQKLKTLGRTTKRLAVAAARRVCGGDVDIIVELEEGSLRTRITVIGAIIGIYSTVANYSGFKQSVTELCDDAQKFAVDVCHPFVKKAEANEDQLYRFERRLKTPGKLKRLSRRLERLQRQTSDLSPKNLAKELAAARYDLDQIIEDISPKELELIKKALASPNLPPPNKWPRAEQPKALLKPSEVQVSMFEDTSEKIEAARRLVYRSRTSVPRSQSSKKARAKTDKHPLLPAP